MNPTVIYENADFLALDKPPGMLVDQVKALGEMLPHDRSKTLAGWLEMHYPGALLVHRLDKDTSGIILAARNPKSYEHFKMLFRERTIKKIYWALVHGIIKKSAGVIDAPIGIKSGMVRHTTHGGNDRHDAITEYRVIKYLEDAAGNSYTLVEAFPKTGRTHQIRVHLNSIHHPIVGDPLYGSQKEKPLGTRQLLHAHSIEFTTPKGGRMQLGAELAPDFQAILDSLKPCDQNL